MPHGEECCVTVTPGTQATRGTTAESRPRRSGARSIGGLPSTQRAWRMRTSRHAISTEAELAAPATPWRKPMSRSNCRKLLPLEEQVVVITGATSGIGRCTAEYMAGRGASLILTARNAAALEQVVANIRRRGGSAVALAGDVADPDHTRLWHDSRSTRGAGSIPASTVQRSSSRAPSRTLRSRSIVVFWMSICSASSGEHAAQYVRCAGRAAV
jgi:hypothetical protein